MRMMKKPSIGVSAEELFVLCVNTFRDEAFRNRLLGYADKVKYHAEENQKRIPADIGGFLEEILPEQVSEEDMVKVYEQKLVGGAGRYYYDQIILHAPLGRCPICGIQQASTLDHYLPKSKVPTLAVDPGNLIPACSDCNHWKKDVLHKDPGMMPVHTYYDVIPAGKWLHAELGPNLEAKYYIECPVGGNWEDGIRKRVTQHLDFYHLHEKYSKETAVELADLKNTWETELEDLREIEGDELPIEVLQGHFRAMIRKRRRSSERADENSYESAFYRALEENMETAFAFFEINGTACAAR